MDTTVVYKDARILIVDDQSQNIDLLERILRRAGYTQIHSTTQSNQVIPIFHEYQPDIILLDLHMPDLDGRDLLQFITPLVPKPVFLPVVILTADITAKAKQEALLLGASDFMSKPLDKVEVLLRIRNLLQSRFLSLAVQQHNQNLEDTVIQKTNELQLAQNALIECLARISKYCDDGGEHIRRIGEGSEKLAFHLNYKPEDAKMIGFAATLHDIGKIGIPKDILIKPNGSLTQQDAEMLKRHTSIGKAIIPNTHLPLLKYAQNIAYAHHERWDGKGYPQGLKGDEIPLEAQIVAIVDLYDTLTHQQPNQSAGSSDRVVVEVTKQRGERFGPDLVKAFLETFMDN